MPVDIKALIRVLNILMSDTEIRPEMDHELIINRSLINLGRNEVIAILQRIEDGTLNIQEILKDV